LTDLIDLMAQPTAQQLADAGMSAAVDHADRVSPRWSDRAFDILAQYALIHLEFMTEDVRNWAERLGFPPAPSARAWGAVALRAARERLIERHGYRKTCNPLAHGTPATLWRSQIYREAA
jgi:hypothetical protein